MRKIISYPLIKNSPILSSESIRNRADIENLIHTYFETVYSNCSIFDANVIGLLEFHPRFDGRIPVQILMNQLGQNKDVFVLEGNDEHQLVLGGDVRTLLLDKKFVLKGWDTKDIKERDQFFNSKLIQLELKLKRLRPDLEKPLVWKRFEDRLSTYQDLSEFKNGYAKGDEVIDRLSHYHQQYFDWILKNRNRRLIDTLQSNIDPSRRTFVMMGAAHYQPSYPLLESWDKTIHETLSDDQIKQYLRQEDAKTAELRRFMNRQKTVILIPKYNHLGPLPKVEIKEELLDKSLEKLCNTHFKSEIIDRAFQNLYALKVKVDSKEQHLLHLTARHNLPNSMAMLIQKGIDIDNAYKGKTALHHAAKRLNKLVFELLLDNKAALDEVNPEGFTPLHLAVMGLDENSYFDDETVVIRKSHQSDQLEIVQLLLDRGAKLNKRSQQGYTPLHIAIRTKSSFDIILALVNAKANLEITNRKGLTALQIAIKYNVDPMVIALLLEKGARVNEKGKGILPLEMAIRENNAPVVSLLLKHGAIQALSISDMESMLELAVSIASSAVVNELLTSIDQTHLSSDFKIRLLGIAESQKRSDVLYFLKTRRSL